jgi:putative DNA primase/helicase
MTSSTQRAIELHPDDLADLRRSGLSDEAITFMNCSSAEVDTIRLRTGVENVASGGYSIPYPGITDQTGQPYMRWRLRQPVDGMRYAAGVGDDPQLYIPPALATLPDSDLLVVTEGEKKAAKAEQEGVHCIGVQGVWSWCNPESRAVEKLDGGRVSEDTSPLASLLDIARKYKHVLVLGDSDLIGNFHARAGFELLAKALSRQGVRTAFSYCPPVVVTDGKNIKLPKQGLDDWLITDKYLATRSLPALFRGAEVAREGITDSYNAIELAELFKGQLAYSQGVWRNWNGYIWVEEKSGVRRSFVAQIGEYYRSDGEKLSHLHGAVMTAFAGMKEEDIPCAVEAWSEQVATAVKSLSKAALEIGNLRGIDSALKLAEPHLHVPEDAWNRDPHLLAVKNGVVDLRTSELLPALPEQWISKSAGATYDPAAEADKFKEFLERVQPDPEIRDYLQRLAGYSAMGTAKEQKFFSFVGGGANGKSTYTGLVMDALGTYTAKGPVSLLVEQSADRPRNDLAALDGARLVSISETPDNLRLDESVVKAVTGQDLISARFLHREFFQFQPCFTPVLDTNHHLRPRDPGEAIWRRMVVIPWAVTIPEKDRDMDLPANLKKELPGVLTWIVEGARLYHENGLPRLQTLSDAVNSLRESCDDIGRWVEAHVVKDALVRTQSSIMYQSYKSWCEMEGNTHPFGTMKFRKDLEDRGFVNRKTGGGKQFWLGLRLRDEDEFLDDVEEVMDIGPYTVPTPLEPAPNVAASAVIVAALVPSTAELAAMPGGSYLV